MGSDHPSYGGVSTGRAGTLETKGITGHEARAVSLLLHGLGAVLVGWACCCWRPADLVAPPSLDTRIPAVEESGTEVAWLDVDVPLRMPAPPKPQLPSVAPPPVVAPAPEPGTGSPIWTAPAPSPPQNVSSTPTAGTPGTGRGTGSGTGETTAFFQVPAQGRSIVYVIDRSSSMGDQGRLALARRELLASLDRLDPPARFQIIAYNRHAEALRIGNRVELLSASAENKQLAARFLESLVAEGGTDHGPALDQAVALHPDVIYFLTDADDLKANDVRAITQLNRGRSAIHTIELSTANRDRAEMPMHILARTNGGNYRAVEVAR